MIGIRAVWSVTDAAVLTAALEGSMGGREMWFEAEEEPSSCVSHRGKTLADRQVCAWVRRVEEGVAGNVVHW